MNEPLSANPVQPRSRINPWTVWIPIILMVLGVVVLYNYLLTQSLRKDKDRPPYLGRLERDITLTERSGREVNLSQLKGKVLVAAYVYTRCPRGCAGVVAKMKQLYDEFGSNPGIQFLSFAVDPGDTPEMMEKFASGLGIQGDNWWFLNGPQDTMRSYLTTQFQFRAPQEMPEEDRLSEDDKYIHDLRVALVDHEGHVRRLCDVMNPDPEFAAFWDDLVRKDLKYLLEEQAKAK